MADARLTISYRFDFSGMIRQLREAADRLEELERTYDNETAQNTADVEPNLTDLPDATPRLVKVDGVITDSDADAAREALRQMEADPYGLKAGLVVQPYTDHGQRKWVFRCWGTDDGCDGYLSLDHTSQTSAESARDRHVADSHAQPGQPQ